MKLTLNQSLWTELNECDAEIINGGEYSYYYETITIDGEAIKRTVECSDKKCADLLKKHNEIKKILSQLIVLTPLDL